MLRSLAIPCTFALLGGCDAPATQLVVLVDTDFAVNEELASLSVAVMDSEGAQVSTTELTLADDGEEPTATTFAMPLSFGVVPVGGDPGRRVTVGVDGIDPDGTTIVRRVVITGFIEETQLLLPIFLARSCRDVFCDAGLTCLRGACVSADVAPSTLPVVQPGEELEFDAGTQAPIDAGPDATPADAPAGDGAACPEVVTCDGPDSCLCSTSCCTIECATSPCLAQCGGMRVCRIEANANAVDVTCQANSTCEVYCADAETCRVACTAPAECVVHCPDTGCEITSCMGPGDLRTCAGDVIACRTGCP